MKSVLSGDSTLICLDVFMTHISHRIPGRPLLMLRNPPSSPSSLSSPLPRLPSAPPCEMIRTASIHGRPLSTLIAHFPHQLHVKCCSSGESLTSCPSLEISLSWWAWLSSPPTAIATSLTPASGTTKGHRHKPIWNCFLTIYVIFSRRASAQETIDGFVSSVTGQK